MKSCKILIVLFLVLFFQNTNAQVSGFVYVDANQNQVFDANEKPLENIMISNGVDIVKTDAKGQYTIAIPQKNPLFLIKPKGYISPINSQGVVEFFINESYSKKEFYNFPLIENQEVNQVKAVLLGDTQVDLIDDVHHVGKLVVEELANQEFDFIVPLGDLTFDSLHIFPDLSKTLGVLNKPVFYTIGNHDVELTKQKGDIDQKYEAHFGPSYYAFEYGNESFLVLNNIFPVKGAKYEGKIDAKQYAFINNYLKNLKTNKLTVFMHIPLEEMVDKDKFLSTFSNIKTLLLGVGHKHTQYYKYFERDKKSPAKELVAGAVCGAWWKGPHDLQGIPIALMNDGTEKGYWLANFYEDKVDYAYKVSGQPASKQMNIWVPEKNDWDKELNVLNEPFIYANVFAADHNTNVSISFDGGKKWQSMQKYEGIAPYLKRLHYLEKLGRFKSLKISKFFKSDEKSEHLWRIPVPKTLEKGTYLLQVKAVNSKIKLNAINFKVFWNE